MEDKVKVTKKNDDTYEVVMLFGDDASTIGSGRIFQDGQEVHSFKTNVAIFSLPTL
jgi:hypothetical protein